MHNVLIMKQKWTNSLSSLFHQTWLMTNERATEWFWRRPEMVKCKARQDAHMVGSLELGEFLHLSNILSKKAFLFQNKCCTCISSNVSFTPQNQKQNNLHIHNCRWPPDVEAFKNLKYPPLQEHSGCYCGPVWPNIGSWDAYLGLPSTTQPESARCNRKWLCSGLRDVRQVRYSRERKKTLWGTTGTIKNNIIRNSWTVLEHGCWGKRGDLSDVSMRGLDKEVRKLRTKVKRI